MMDTNLSFRLPKKLQLCRLCLLHKDSLVNIHEPNVANGFVIAVEISDLLQLNVFPGDGLPDVICFDCLFDLSKFKRFKKNSHEAEVTLKYILNHNEVNLNSGLMAIKEENLKEFGFQDNSIDNQVRDIMLEGNLNSTSTNVHSPMNEEEIHGFQNALKSGGFEIESSLSKTQITPEDKARQTKHAKNTLGKSNSIPVEGSQAQRKSGSIHKSIKLEKVEKIQDAEKDACVSSLGIDIVEQNELKTNGDGDHHNASTREIINFESHNLYKCSDCLTVFNDEYSFRSHMSSGLCTSPHNCSIGKESFLSSICFMERHISYRSPVRSNDLGQKEFAENNHELIGIPNYLQNHCSPLNNDGNYPRSYPKDIHASISNEAFQKNYNQDCNLNSHSLTLIMKRGFVCDICGSCFRKKIVFEHHLMKYHSQRLSFSCGICQKTFLTKGGLKEHLVVHSTERPFMCDICGSAFKLRKKLLRHIRTCHSEKQLNHLFIPV